QGASTITQQVIKNTLLSQARSVERKSQEIMLAGRVEATLGKRRIFEIYVNQIYFGEGRYGVEEAARWYFGKSAAAVDLGEAAVLAALPRAPGVVTCYRRVAELEARRDYVLRQMVEHGFAEAEAIEPFLGKPIEALSHDASSAGLGEADEFVDLARAELIRRYGEDALPTLGATVHTTVDLNLQRVARAAGERQLEALEARHGYGEHARPLSERARKRLEARAPELVAGGRTSVIIDRLEIEDEAEHGDQSGPARLHGHVGAAAVEVELPATIPRDLLVRRFPVGGAVSVQVVAVESAGTPALAVLEPKTYPDNWPKLAKLEAGEVGFLICNVKEVVDSKVGDTIVLATDRESTALPGFKEVQQMVFAGVFPTDSADYADLRDALGKLTLNDASVTWEPETSDALGFGFRLGFLGLLHMEIIQERLEREYDLDLITTAPSVKFRVTHKSGEVEIIDNPARFPEAGDIEVIEEPMIIGRIQLPEEHLGPVMKLCQDRRGIQQDLSYLTTSRVQVTYELPLAEVVFGFYDQLKSISRGYASLDYDQGEYRRADLVRLDLLVNGEKVDALSLITHRDSSFNRGRDLCVKMKEEIPRQQFEVAIQAAVGTRIIARTTVKALRKNVLAKCYGGDASRKRKLLEKQKKGKKRLKAVGNVEIPQGAFHAILKIEQ
ncbi:MAG: translation elongation factor 4, partial [Myxococcales bacterium]|nr:translation elongation factor 4 [Myxococcales bacterium]